MISYPEGFEYRLQSGKEHITCLFCILADGLKTTLLYTTIILGIKRNILTLKLSPDDVKAKITEKVEPLQYFEFEFSNVYVKKVTYDNGTNAQVRKKILL